GGAEDLLELADVQPRDDDLVGDADADAERVGEAIENRQALQRLVERVPAVVDRIDVELSDDVGGVQRDVEELETRLQDLEGEARVLEAPEVRGHAEAGNPHALRKLDVVEELRVDRRLAAGEEQHVELAVGVQDHLSGRVRARHETVAGIELLAAEEAVAVAG